MRGDFLKMDFVRFLLLEHSRPTQHCFDCALNAFQYLLLKNHRFLPDVNATSFLMINSWLSDEMILMYLASGPFNSLFILFILSELYWIKYKQYIKNKHFVSKLSKGVENWTTTWRNKKYFFKWPHCWPGCDIAPVMRTPSPPHQWQTRQRGWRDWLSVLHRVLSRPSDAVVAKWVIWKIYMNFFFF